MHCPRKKRGLCLVVAVVERWPLVEVRLYSQTEGKEEVAMFKT